MLHTILAAVVFPNLLAEAGAGATVVGGVIGFLWGGTSRSRQSLENLALGAAIGGFAGCLISILVYLFSKVAVS